jgi:hypothetical protein
MRLLPFRLSSVLLSSAVKQTIYLVVGSIALAGAVWLVWAILQDRQLEKGFDGIKAGTTEREVLQRLGHPKRVEKCGEFFGPIPKGELDGCAREYLYASPFAPLLPQYFVVRFDERDRVKSTAAYSSQ